MPLLTVGHGTLDSARLRALLTGFAVDTVVDVRRFPGSRRNHDVSREALAGWLPRAGIAYHWEERLGGRRHLPADQRALSPDTWWRVEAFRAYAGYTRTEPFAAALGDLAVEAASARVAVLCSETLWWRCHRRIIADVASLTWNRPVHHLMHDGTEVPHQPSAGAKVSDDGVFWDATSPQFPESGC